MITTIKTNARKLIAAAAIFSFALVGQSAMAGTSDYTQYGTGDDSAVELLDAINRNEGTANNRSRGQSNVGRTSLYELGTGDDSAVDLLDAINRGTYTVR